MSLLLTRRAALIAAASLAAAGPALAQTAAGAEPRALVVFDSDALAAGARALLREKGFGLDEVDLRARQLGFADARSSGVVVVAMERAAEARAFARTTARAFGCTLLVYGPRGWTHHVYAAEHEWRENETDEVRAGMVLEAALRDHARRPGPLIRA